MRSDEDVRSEVEEQVEPGPDGDRRVQGPQTPAERVAARRRLDQLAESP